MMLRVACVFSWVILSSLSPAGTAAADASQDYMLHCMGCHGRNAEGVENKVPPLARTLVQFMRTPAGRNFVLRVPGASNSMLSDAALADVLNWIADRYGGPEGTAPVDHFTPAEVAASRHTPLAGVKSARRLVIQELATTGPAPSADY